MRLNTERIDAELKRINKKRAWLAQEVGVTRQAAYWWFENPERVPLTTIEKISNVLHFSPKDLIK